MNGLRHDDDDDALLGTAKALPGDRRGALLAAALLLLACVATAPFATVPLAPVPSLVPAYNAAVIVLDVVTAVFLWVLYRDTGEASFLAIACGYVFTPVVILAHALTFPDAFVPGPLIGGEQSTAWLWVVWHGGFPFFVIAYALLARPGGPPGPAAARAGALPFLLTLGAAAGLAAVPVFWGDHLPRLMAGSRYESAATQALLALAWLVHLAGLILLARRTRLKRLIDLWLAVSLLASAIDLMLSALLVTGRYQLGFYAGRVYGLLATAFVLTLLLREAIGLSGRYLRTAAERRAAWRQLRDNEDRLQVLVTELQHRTRNLMAVVRSMADRTLTRSKDLETFRQTFSDRLAALARVQGLLSRLGEGDRVTFDELLRVELAAHGALESPGVRLGGPTGVQLRSNTAQILAMALHELATNASKYGALKQQGAVLNINWALDEGDAPRLRIDWHESGVTMPAADAVPDGGQGRELIERALPYQLKARTRYVLSPDGVQCSIDLPVPMGAFEA